MGTQLISTVELKTIGTDSHAVDMLTLLLSRPFSPTGICLWLWGSMKF